MSDAEQVGAASPGELAPNSEKSWDVQTRAGTRLQVKSRVVSDPPRSGQLQLSPFRSFDFDEAVVVLFSDQNYSVAKAVQLPVHLVEAAAAYNEHVNGHIAHAPTRNQHFFPMRMRST